MAKPIDANWIKGEANARHGAFVFLILFTLTGMDIRSKKSKLEQERATHTWLAWGITFLLLAFFIIAPEQELMARNSH